MDGFGLHGFKRCLCPWVLTNQFLIPSYCQYASPKRVQTVPRQADPAEPSTTERCLSLPWPHNTTFRKVISRCLQSPVTLFCELKATEEFQQKAIFSKVLSLSSFLKSFSVSSAFFTLTLHSSGCCLYSQYMKSLRLVHCQEIGDLLCFLWRVLSYYLLGCVVVVDMRTSAHNQTISVLLMDFKVYNRFPRLLKVWSTESMLRRLWTRL